MLSPRSLNQPIKTFSLMFRNVVVNSDQPIVNAWVKTAILRRVQEFHLGMHGHILTPIIFTSRTLVILKLENLKIVSDNLCFDLPSRKTLVLERVYFKNQKNDFVKLLNACPILEDLHTYYPKLRFMKRKYNNEVQELKSLFLSKLVRAYIHSIDVPFDAVNNVEYLCIIQDEEERPYWMNIEEHSFEIKIEVVSFKGIPVFQNLIRIELWFFSVFRGWDGVVELLQHCPKLQKNFIRKVCAVVTFFFFFFLLAIFFIYILLNVILYLFCSGIPAYPRNGTAQFQLLNVFRLTSCHVLFYTLKDLKTIFNSQHIFCRMRGF